ncbi:MAG: lysostaphin resistance A-like protein [Candidatus Dormibacteraceae bacterium]
MRIREALRVRPALRPLGWVLLCTQAPSLLILAISSSLSHKLSVAMTHTLRGVGFGICVSALWYFKTRSPIGQIKHGIWRWMLGLVLGLGWGYATVLLSGGAHQIGGIPHLTNGGWLGKALVVFMIGAWFPFFEELLFRGVVIQQLRVLRSGRTFLVIASASIFLLMHLAYGMGWANLVQFFAAGIVLGWLAVSSESLWPSIFLHAGYNTVLVLTVLIAHL